MDMLIGLLLAGLVGLAVILQRAYSHLPIKELKRRVHAEDDLAARLHRAAVYEVSLRFLLWFLLTASLTAFFVFAATHWPIGLVLFIGEVLLLSAFAWLPAWRLPRWGWQLAAFVAPALAWVLHLIHAPITWLYERLRPRARPRPTVIYEKEDLLALVNHQNEHPENRIPEAELELAFNALTFGDKVIGDFMAPRRKVKSVSIEDAIGPILMDELHASGFRRFPVYEGKKSNIVGTLFLKDLVDTADSAQVRSIMRPSVYYVHEDQPLHDALQAILRTHHHLLIVVNDKAEYVGALTVEHVLEQLIGQAILDEFDQYDDRRAVAQRSSTKASREPTEVIE